MEFPRLCSLLIPELLLDVAALGLAWFLQLHGHAAWDRWELWHPLHKRDLGRWTATWGLEVVRASPCVWTQVQGHGEWILKQNIQTHQHQPGADVIGHNTWGQVDLTLPLMQKLRSFVTLWWPQDRYLSCICNGTQMTLIVRRKQPWLRCPRDWWRQSPAILYCAVGASVRFSRLMVIIVLVLMKLMLWCRFEKTK